jgi:hypothetical protein
MYLGHCPSVLIVDVKTRSAQLPFRNWNFGVHKAGNNVYFTYQRQGYPGVAD